MNIRIIKDHPGGGAVLYSPISFYLYSGVSLLLLQSSICSFSLHENFMTRLVLTCSILLCSLFSSAQSLSLTNLRCEYKINPLGIESPAPRLSWELTSVRQNTLQTAYRVIVSDDPALLEKNIGNIWDSKQTNSAASIQVAYGGRKMEPVKNYFWKVMVWDNHSNSSAWSNAASWQTGLLAKPDWKGAAWIAYDRLPDSNRTILPTDGKPDKYKGTNVLPLLRKDFTVSKPVSTATMFICGLGQFELHVNGDKTGDHFLDPGWTKYDKQALYVPFDVTRQLKQGSNTIGVMLGNGFYYIPPVSSRYRKLKAAFGYPKMICRLAIRYEDGSTQDIVSNLSWKTAPGPIAFSSIYGGEDYDANKESPGWDKPGFQDGQWETAQIVDGPPEIDAQQTDPIKIMQEFAPVKVYQSQSQAWIYDLGQNASGIPFIKLRGKKGDTVRIVPGELLTEAGLPNQKASGSPCYFEYILKGEETETWQPRFTYYGFRYLQLKGAVPRGEPNPQRLPQVEELKGLHVRNSAERTGEFSSSSELFNKTYTLIDWAVRSNMMSVFTDCPHREKLGWLEEAHLMGPSVRYNYNIATLCNKIVQDMINSQTDSGLIPEIAPEYVRFEWGNGMFRDSPEWGSSSVLIPWYMFQWYGDKRLLEKAYPMMVRYMAYLKSKAKNHILSQGLGDWYDIGPKAPGVSQLTPMGITGTAIYYYDLDILHQIAVLLGKPADGMRFNVEAAAVKKSFNAHFFNDTTKQYGTGSQAANAMAVYMGLVDPANKQAVVNNIVKDLQNRNNSLTAGDIGYRYLLRVLDDEGRSDVIFNMNNRSDVPGYGYQLAKGATALTESWQAFASSSNNHFMLGHLLEWFYSGLGGIRPAAGSIAFNKIEIRPEPVGDINKASTVYQSPYGLIKTDWKKDKNAFELKVVIPANTIASIYLPEGYVSHISVNGKEASQNGDVLRISKQKDRIKVETGSGTYLLKAEASR